MRKSYEPFFEETAKKFKYIQLNEITNSITQTPNFKKWFGKSKVVDTSGKPLVVFHGSNSNFNIFDSGKIGTNTDPGIWGKGFYFSDALTARSYGSMVRGVYLSIENPFIIEEGQTIEEIAEHLGIDESTLQVSRGFIRPKIQFINLFTGEIKYRGYDGIIVNRPGKSKEYIAFHPNQIKSADINNGNFSKASDNIYETFIDSNRKYIN